MTTQEQHEAVAIVGMGCRWPGGVRNAPELWEFLKNKGDAWREFDDPRFSTRGFHHPNADRPGTVAMKGAFLAEEDARLFDHSFFSMTGLEVETMDPSQRKLLEVTYEALENAGETWESVSGSRTGVFIGNFCLDHWMIQSRDWDNPRPYAFTGAGTSILANRISYIFNFNGPSLTVDTACSSSMYALHLAMNAIRAGDCDSAVVASANWIADPGVQIALDKLGALSASGRCHTFDSRAQGYARGEGYGAIYLKRATSAVADGSPIRALIRGSSMNANGRTGGITRPSPAGQEAVIREAYRNAGNLPFADTSYFECHGTGTYVGDPLEVAAVGRVFAGERPADSPLLVGSVKTNFGHCEGASALASIMKVVMSLEHGEIPPIFDLQTLNPNVDFDGAGVEVVRDLIQWPVDAVRRASINSFGYGGANGHCIIDHVHTLFPDYVKPGVYQQKSFKNTGSTNGHTNGHTNGNSNGSANGHANKPATNGDQNGQSMQHHPIATAPKMTRSPNAETRKLVLLPFSAHNKDSLKSNMDALSGVIHKFPLADIAYTLGLKRSRQPHRTFRVVNKDEPAEGLGIDGKVLKSPLQRGSVGFIFTGQGAQWAAMGAELFEYHIFRTSITYLDHVLSTLPAHPAWTLSDILSGKSDPELIQSAEVSQTVCTALQIGLVDLLASWSVRPIAVAGHSSGEIGAAYASGRVSAAEAIVAAYFRGQAVARNKQDGLMLAVGLGPEQTFPYISGREEKVRIAAYNSPGSVTLSGDTEAVQEVSALLNKDGIFNRALKTGGNAYHSHHMLPLGRDYDALLSEGLAHIKVLDNRERYAQIPWLSSVTPGKTPSAADLDGPAYWRANLESPVRFTDAVENLANLDEVQVLIEIGPHPALKSPINQILKKVGKDSAIDYASTLKRQQDGVESMLELAGTLFCLNTDVDLAAVNAVDTAAGPLEHGSIAVDLPTYQYTYGPVAYHESRHSKEYRYRKVIRHDLLGSKVIGNAKLRPQWRNLLRVKDVPWLADHRLLPDVVFPGAGYIALAVEAASRIHKEYPAPAPAIVGYSLRNVSIKSGLTIPEDDFGIEIMTSMELVDVATAQSPMWATFSVSSVTRESEEWTEHCTGLVRVEIAETGSLDTGLSMHSSTARATDITSWYKTFESIGLGYGKTFQPLSDISIDEHDRNQVSSQIALKTTSGIIKGGESPYVLHPASLDGAIQLGLIACHEGQADQANTAFVPVQFSQLYLSADIPQDLESASAVARGERRGLRSAHLDFAMKTPDGREFLQVEGLQCVSYSRKSQALEKAYSAPFTRLVWKPDFRSLDDAQCHEIFPLASENVEASSVWGIVTKLSHAIVYNIYENFAGENATVPEPKPTGEVAHYFNWIKRRGTLDENELRSQFKQLSSKDRLAKLNELVSQAPDVIEVKIAMLLHDNMADILAQTRTGIDVIISAGLLSPLYEKGMLMTGAHPQFYNIINSLGHANPNMRYFEIGGGTGGASRVALSALRGPNGIKSYEDYTFTDISPGFLTTARESLGSTSGLDGMVYNVLDIEQDPLPSGYERIYDVIIACQVLHATSNIKNTLTNVGKLLKPGGKLVLEETTQNFIVPAVVVGTFTGYWAGIPDGRIDTPFMTLGVWDKVLREAGFSGTEIVLDDFPHPHNTTSTIVSTFIGTREPKLETQLVGDDGLYLLYSSVESTPPSLLTRLSHEFEGRRVPAKSGPLRNYSSVPQASDVVVFLDEKHLQLDSAELLTSFQYLSRYTSNLVIITSTGIVKGRNPDGALIPGLLRVLKTENPASRFLSIDIDGDNFILPSGSEAETSSLTRCIADKVVSLLSGDEGSSIPSDREYVWQDGCLWVSRIVAVPEEEIPVPGEYYGSDGPSTGEAATQLLPLDSHTAVRATFGTPGVIGSLYFAPNKELWTVLPQDSIDVKVTAVSVDYDDLDAWSGRTDTTHGLCEFTGIVTAVGDKIGDRLAIGDRVCGLSTGRFQVGNSARIPAELALKLQPEDDDVQMATLPRAYATATYAFERIAHLPPADEAWTGKSILVMSATTPAALAAITLANAKGADVYVIMSTTEYASSHIRQKVIPASNIFASQNRAAGLRKAADAAKESGGFDIILSTTQEDLELLYLTPRYLRAPGYLIHTGRIEGQSAALVGGLDMGTLAEKNAIFSPVSLETLIDRTPALGRQLLRSVEGYYRQGLIKPTQLFGGSAIDVGDLSNELADFSKSGGAAGNKLVVSFKQPKSQIKTLPPVPTAQFDANSCYIVTGALGGLGQSIVKWMVTRGARHLMLLSRRSIDKVPDAKQLVGSLTSRGVDVQPVVCDITDLGQLKSALDKVSLPIRGVVHAAVSWRDLSFDKLTLDRWQESLAAKVQGTKNLHEATLTMPLDFFVMTTSLLSVYALATQAAYTAANNFQDAFARHRRQLGLPASTVSFSLIRSVGNTGSNQDTIDTFERNKTLTLREQQFLALFEPAFLREASAAVGTGTGTSKTASGVEPVVHDPLSTANLITCLDPAAMAAKLRDGGDATGSTPRWHNDARVAPLMRAFADAQQHALNQSTQDSGAGGGGAKSAAARLQQEIEAGIRAGPAERAATVALIEGAISSTVASMLFIDPEGVDPAKSVADYGVDSLIAAELRNWFVDVLKTDISMLKLLDQSQSMRALSAKIVDDRTAQASSKAA